jgi:hypothetical protein
MPRGSHRLNISLGAARAGMGLIRHRSLSPSAVMRLLVVLTMLAAAGDRGGRRVFLFFT